MAALNLEEAQAARANALATLAYLDKIIKELKPKDYKKLKRDFSAVDARVQRLALKKYRKITG
jgi:hypothetical protein